MNLKTCHHNRIPNGLGLRRSLEHRRLREQGVLSNTFRRCIRRPSKPGAQPPQGSSEEMRSRQTSTLKQPD